MGGRVTKSSTSPSTIPVSSLAHNPRNRRDSYDDVEELAATITEYGILQPLGVVRYEIFLARWPEHEDEIGSAHWVVMQGNRRLAAARSIGLDEVPVAVQERLGRSDRLDESILIENVHRQDLPHLQQAGLVQELVNKHGSQTAAAKVIGKSIGWVSQRLRLLTLVPELQTQLAAGQLPVEQARELGRLSPEEQQEHLSQAVEESSAGTSEVSAGEERSKSGTTRAGSTAKSRAGAAKLATTLRRRSPEEIAVAAREAFSLDERMQLVELLKED